ncbi:MAG: hypothetical protein ABIM43_05390 [candidate division WOR-3 bacterium]
MKINKQLVGNIGLFYVCYELSKKGWNCLPTTRNAKGVDIVIYGQDGKKRYTIEVKSLSGRNAVPFGSKPTFMSDFVVICRKVFSNPEVFILTSEEVKQRLNENKGSYWLEVKSYEEFKDEWEKIGEGYK